MTGSRRVPNCFRSCRLCARWRWIAVGTETAVARIVLDQERKPPANHGSQSAEREIGSTPSQTLDQERCQWRHHQRTDADSAYGETGGETAASDKPPLHRANGGNIGAADAKPDPKSIGA